MYIAVGLAVIANILSIIMLSIGLFYNFKQPKSKALYGYLIAGSIILYIVLSSLFAIYGLFIKQILYSLILFLCVASIFIIGHIVNYKTLKKYTVVQILCFIVSLATLLMFL